MLRKLPFLFFFIVYSTFCYSQEWSLQNMMEVKRIGNVAVSPDGKSVVFEVKEETQPNLFLLKQDSSKTTEIAQKASSPAWSPNSELIAYLNTSSNQIELYSVKTGKAQPLTQLSGEITTFRWNPNGKALAFLMQKPQDQKAISSIPEEEKPYQELWLISTDGKQLKQLTDGSFHVGAGFFSNHFTFSPNGTEIICPKMPSAETDRWDETELVKIDLINGHITSFVSAPAVEPYFSPDGKWVAYLKQDPSWSFIEDVWILPAEGGKPRPLAHTFNRDILKVGALLGWSKDSQPIFALDYRNIKAELYSLPITGESAIYLPIDIPVIKNASLNGDHRLMGFVAESSDRPEELSVAIPKENKSLALLVK